MAASLVPLRAAAWATPGLSAGRRPRSASWRPRGSRCPTAPCCSRRQRGLSDAELAALLTGPRTVATPSRVADRRAARPGRRGCRRAGGRGPAPAGRRRTRSPCSSSVTAPARPRVWRRGQALRCWSAGCRGAAAPRCPTSGWCAGATRSVGGRPHDTVDAATAVTVADLLRRVEKRLGEQQEIEWALVDGRVVLLCAGRPSRLPSRCRCRSWCPRGSGSATSRIRRGRGPRCSDRCSSTCATRRCASCSRRSGCWWRRWSFRQIGGWEYSRLVPLGGKDRQAAPVRCAPAAHAGAARDATADPRLRRGGARGRGLRDGRPLVRRVAARPHRPRRRAEGRGPARARRRRARRAHRPGARAAARRQPTALPAPGRVRLPGGGARLQPPRSCWAGRRSARSGSSRASRRCRRGPRAGWGRSRDGPRAHPRLRALLATGVPRLDAVRAVAPEVADELDGYIAEFGQRSLSFEIADPSIAELPALTLRLFVDFARRGYDPEAERSALAAARAEAVAEARRAARGPPRRRPGAVRAGAGPRAARLPGARGQRVLDVRRADGAAAPRRPRARGAAGRAGGARPPRRRVLADVAAGERRAAGHGAHLTSRRGGLGRVPAGATADAGRRGRSGERARRAELGGGGRGGAPGGGGDAGRGRPGGRRGQGRARLGRAASGARDLRPTSGAATRARRPAARGAVRDARDDVGRRVDLGTGIVEPRRVAHRRVRHPGCPRPPHRSGPHRARRVRARPRPAR